MATKSLSKAVHDWVEALKGRDGDESWPEFFGMCPPSTQAAMMMQIWANKGWIDKHEFLTLFNVWPEFMYSLVDRLGVKRPTEIFKLEDVAGVVPFSVVERAFVAKP